ncbi:asparaginase [Nocardioides terrae]|uniref:Asparaginase n=1 Tax=Nocardioides terrae TaxID=574651 RepID=A0A1I1EJZ1_9ACTN|nr:asparaginase [Nocardioides terrae]SFB87387.1 asparaginase [Nocardioides terrae]
MSVAVAEIVRSGFVEGRHHGSVVALDADGRVAWSVGDVTSPILPRSTNKPLQAVAMVGLGLDLPPRLLALAAASHSGEEIHLAGVREILGTAGLTEQALGNIADLPFDPGVRDRWLRDGRGPSKIAQNCSGKHAAMIATCVVRDWQLAGYVETDHPLQVLIQRRFEALTGEPAQVAVDGCGAPVLSASLTGLAGAFRTLALATEGPERRVADAIREFPEYVSGAARDELRLLRALPGAIGKLGAEAVYAVALPDGRAVALKIDDGGDRARPVVMAEALRRIGVESTEVDAIGTHSLLGGGVPVGGIRASF